MRIAGIEEGNPLEMLLTTSALNVYVVIQQPGYFLKPGGP
jgi:hypothetical protein